MARRLLEINARKREERLAEDEEQLNQLLAIKVWIVINTLFCLRSAPDLYPVV